MKCPGPFLFCLLAALAGLGCGCEAFRPVSSQPPQLKAPFAYEPLNVRNSCFVESVHFYDTYCLQRPAAPDNWVRVLQWGNQEGDFSIGSGHAVAVFTQRGQLYSYDINNGFCTLDLPVGLRGDLTEVGPRIFARYPQFKPVFARYRDDSPHAPPPKPPEFLFYHANPDVRDATRVASELGRYRPVNVVAFAYKEAGRDQESAVAVFVFGSRLCVYFPRGGTHVSNPLIRTVDDLRWAGAVIRTIYPTATNIRQQGGGNLLFPPAVKPSE